jgi:hypothetical protein
VRRRSTATQGRAQNRAAIVRVVGHGEFSRLSRHVPYSFDTRGSTFKRLD